MVKINKDGAGGCWIWTASKKPRGYGQFAIRVNGKNKNHYAHRLSYEIHVGPIPEGMQLDHICRVRSCVNPDHLRVVTNMENHQNLGDGPRVDNRGSGARNVYRHHSGRWEVKMLYMGKSYHGGRYDDIEEAKRAAVAMRARVCP